MTSEKDDWAQLIAAGLLPGDEYFSPSKAAECFYSGMLKRHQKEQGARGMGRSVADRKIPATNSPSSHFSQRKSRPRTFPG